LCCSIGSKTVDPKIGTLNEITAHYLLTVTYYLSEMKRQGKKVTKVTKVTKETSKF